MDADAWFFIYLAAVSLLTLCGAGLIWLAVFLTFHRWGRIRSEEDAGRLLHGWAEENLLQLQDHRPRGRALLILSAGGSGSFAVTARDAEGRTRRGLVRIRTRSRFFLAPGYRVELRAWAPEPKSSPDSPGALVPEPGPDPLWDRWLDGRP
jgi:hypothetical protein